MKVADIMNPHVDYVTTNTSVRDVSRLIFGRGINGVPVVKNKTLVGFITERDILSKFYPSIQEYVEDPIHMSDFEGMEKNVSEIFSFTAEKIMSKNPITVTPDTPVLKAQSLMFVNKVGRLPVIDKKSHLVGIVSKGDIFRTVVGDKLPMTENEEYHDWLSKHYDLVINWGERLGYEVPDLTALFKKEKIDTIVDVGCGTGEHDIALARSGFHVFGLESSTLMSKSAMQKKTQLPKIVSEKVHFESGDYIRALRSHPAVFNAAIFMGNALCHLWNNYEEVISAVSKSMISNSLIVIQVVNFEKVFKVKKRLLDVNFAKSKLGPNYEHAFIEFYDPPIKKGSNLTLTMMISDSDGNKWKSRSMNSVPIANLGQEEITKLLKKNGFNKITCYGSMFWGPLFSHPFKPLESDWLNIVAKR